MTDKEFLRWFSGFLDGEGSFSIRFHFCGKHIKVGQYIIINMTIDDLPILNEIKNRVGGYVKKTRDETLKWKAQRAWEVSNFKDCLRISNLLLKFPLQSRKARDFDGFYKALSIIENKRKRGWKSHWYKEELITLAKIRDNMWGRKGGRARGYRTEKDIREFIELSNYHTIEEL
jgi:hypothetical protein